MVGSSSATGNGKGHLGVVSLVERELDLVQSSIEVTCCNSVRRSVARVEE